MLIRILNVHSGSQSSILKLEQQQRMEEIYLICCQKFIQKALIICVQFTQYPRFTGINLPSSVVLPLSSLVEETFENFSMLTKPCTCSNHVKNSNS